MSRTLFISYSHSDEKPHRWVERLSAFLDAVYERLPLDPWVDSRLTAGTRWEAEIEDAVERAAATILVVGTGFLKSKFIKERELPPLLKAADAKKLRLYPLVVEHVPWKHSVLRAYQAFNDPDEPLEGMKEPEQNAWMNKLVCKIVDDMRDEQVLSGLTAATTGSAVMDLRKIRDHLEATLEAFRMQARRRNLLVGVMRDRLGITERLEYERFFNRYFDEMDAEELHEFRQIRALTEGTMHDGNRGILEILEAAPGLRDELPILAALRVHLIVWLNKYDKIFTTSERMAVLYVGVEDGVPFPRGVDGAVAHWLAERST